jgi:AcrR family transcriptional regulator
MVKRRPRPATTTSPSTHSTTADAERAAVILDAAIQLARETGWSYLRLHQLAQRLGMPLDELRVSYRDQDALADAWFRRAELAMLRPMPGGFADLPVAERVATALDRWFQAVGQERRITLDMIGTKLYPSHPHHWVPLVFNLSRLIQWLREAARLDAAGRRRQVEEIGLTALFLAALVAWRGDASVDRALTRRIIRGGAARLFRARDEARVR